MTSNYIKAALSAYFRFKRQCSLIATECGYYNSDFLALTKDKLIEVEIKTSKADLRNDFKKPKHKIYQLGDHEWTPHVFYFAVPSDLVEYAVSRCADTKYGVLEVSDGNSGRRKRQWYVGTAVNGEISKEVLTKVKREIMTYGYENVTFSGLSKAWGSGMYLNFESDTVIPWDSRVRTIKRARPLTKNTPSSRIKTTMIKRLSSEMASLRIKSEKD